jgi:hypothetical protein
MPTFRSKLLDVAGQTLTSVGLIGFLACGAVDMSAQWRLLGKSEFTQPTAERTMAIQLKGQNLFVEQVYGRRLQTADYLMMWFWPIGATGVALGNRKLFVKRTRKFPK